MHPAQRIETAETPLARRGISPEHPAPSGFSILYDQRTNRHHRNRLPLSRAVSTIPESFWKLLVEGREAVSEVPADRWNIERYYDPEPGVAG